MEVVRMNISSVPGEVQEARLEQWLSEYGDSVLRTCFIYLSDRTLAEDAMQDTFIKVWRSMDKFEGRNSCSAKTWIMRIAINTCKDYKRSSWYRHIDLSKAIDDLPSSFYKVTTESQQVFFDVMRLPAKYKQVILLYFYHDMTMSEVADVLGSSRSTVQHQLQKAYTMLRHQPEGRGFDEE
jgi:RNA polymerase sigma-70 factor (ECF subfamily)